MILTFLAKRAATFLFLTSVLLTPARAGTINGTIRDVDNYLNVYGGVGLEAYDDSGQLVSTAVSDSLGHYELPVPAGFTGTLVMSSLCHEWPFGDQVLINNPVGGTDTVTIDLQATAYILTFGGWLIDQETEDPAGNIPVVLFGNGNHSNENYQTTSQSTDGVWWVELECGWTGVLETLGDCFTKFTATDFTNTPIIDHVVDLEIVGDAKGPYTISGALLGNGSPLIGVPVTMHVDPGSPVTTTDGTYSIADVTCGSSVTVTPDSYSYAFSPESKTHSNVTGNVAFDYSAVYSVPVDPRITAPNGGDSLRIGNHATVSWEYDTGREPDSASILIGDGTNFFELWDGVDGELAADGQSFDWVVSPLSVPNLIARIETTTAGAEPEVQTDDSDAPFQVVGGFYREEDHGRTFSTPYTPPFFDQIGPGAAFIDFSDNLALEILLTTPNGVKLYSQASPGNNFSDTTAYNGLWTFSGNARGVAVADFDNDRQLDLYVTACGSPNALFRHLVSDNGQPPGVDHDFQKLPVAPGDDNGCAESAAWGDYDDDGNVDLYVTYSDGPNRLYRNLGESAGYAFTQVSAPLAEVPEPSYSAVWGDYDNDGDLDLYVATHGTADHLLRNNGNGNFSEVSGNFGLLTTAGDSNSASWGDYDNDGYLDLYVTQAWTIPFGSINVLYRNLSGQGFQLQAGKAPGDPGTVSRAASFVDYDGDGRLDIYVANADGVIGPNNFLYRNTGSGFSLVTDFQPLSESEDSYGMSWGDSDGDGDPDLFLVERVAGSNPVVGHTDYMRNFVGDSANWLRLRLSTHGDDVSNGGAIGARVIVSDSGVTQTREIGGGGNFHSQNATTVEIGGVSTSVDSVTVRWPSGRETVMTNVLTVNGIVTVSEPGAPPPPPPPGCRGCPDIEDGSGP